MADTVDAVRQINDTIRRTYAQLVETRNAQLQYMTRKRQGKKEFAFLITPDLVLQYNYVHQLMRSFHTALPPDICAEDGGITCSNLSVLKFDRTTGVQLQSFSTSVPPSDTTSDYVASRIVDLLDRPVTIGDQDLTMNVRDEFAANIRTLNMLFEERYKMCQEQSGRLKDELSATRQQLVASRAAGLEAVTNAASDDTVQRLREQIARYEVQLRVIREQMKSLQEMNENTIRRNQEEVEELMRRVNTTGRTEHSDAFLRLLHSLFESLEGERDRVLSAIQQIQLVNDRRSDEFSRILQQQQQQQQQQPQHSLTSAAAPGPTDAREFEKRVQNEVAVRVQDEVRSINRRIDEEVSARAIAVEGITRARLQEELEVAMRTKLQDELNRQSEELQRRFDDAVTAKVAQALDSSIQVLTTDQLSTMLTTSQQQPVPAVIPDACTRYKESLDKVLTLKDSMSNVLPMRPQYELPKGSAFEKEYEIMRVLYGYVEYLLSKLKDMYKFCRIQSGYLYNLGMTASKVKLSLQSMDEERAEIFHKQVDAIMTDQMSAAETHKHQILALLNRLTKEVSEMKTEFEKYHRNKVYYQANKQKIPETDDRELQLLGMMKEMRDTIGGPLTDKERDELELLRVQSITNRTTIRELETSIQQMIAEDSRRFEDVEAPGKLAYAQAQLKTTISQQKELIYRFRTVFNELGHFTIDAIKRMKGMHRGKLGTDELQSELAKYESTLSAIFTSADSVLDYGKSPTVNVHSQEIHSSSSTSSSSSSAAAADRGRTKHAKHNRAVPYPMTKETSSSSSQVRQNSATPAVVSQNKPPGFSGQQHSTTRKKRKDKWMDFAET